MRRPGFVVLAVLCLFHGGTALVEAQGLYWDEPALFSPRSGSFPVSDYNGSLSAVVWQETTPSGEGGVIDVSLAVKQGRAGWITRNRAASYTYSGSEPAILSMTIDARGRILIAAAASATETDILISSDLGESFERRRLEMGSESSVAPRIVTRADGGYLLFVTRGRDQNLTLYYSRSDDGFSWTSFQPFITEQGRTFNFLPSHTSYNGREYVVYQSQVVSGDDMSFQLFIKSSGDNGRSWSSSARITGFRDPLVEGAGPEQFDNQRPHLSVQQNRLFVVWERRYRNQAPQIYGTYLGNDGSVAGVPDRINADDAYCNNPVAFELKGTTSVIWFDNSQGTNRIMLASRNSLGRWDRAADLSRGAGGEASFGRPVLSGDNLAVFWQSSRQNQNRIYSLAPDTTVARPQILARNFTPGGRTRNSTAIIGWTPPRAGAAIRGYAWSWSRRAGEEPPRQIMSAGPMAALEQNADEDGTWYFSLIAQDYTGNWSDPVGVSFIRDTTAPP
ncbi:MAG: glycoside hydrolase, partial [Treponema sp.]|nr:glycoside hydrolase [Treponema sp.]